MDTTDDPGHLLGGNEPLHLQLREHLRAQILNHSLPPGTSLPSEAQLQARFGVSRSVVRQALGALEADGLILRGRGRGSTVAPRREHHRQVHQTSGLSTQVAGTGATVGTEVLALNVQASDVATSVLGTAQVLSVERLRTADGVPIAFIHTWLPLPQFASLTAADLTNASLHDVMGRMFGVEIVSGKRQIRAVPGDRDLTSLLGLQPTSPVLLLEGTSYDADGRAVEVFSTWHHPDHVVFDIDVTAGRGTDTGAEPAHAPVSSLTPVSSHTPTSKDDSPDAELVAERARTLGGELLRLACELDGLKGPV